ncbi:Dbl homology domain-containing protein [Pholiota conissans]|uniref:Dbl homology domain-containing protein n=1 Tax=Pholiota conissans TaxID=109636 RepID=A0A9P6D3P3_9AGAR|nr:Dbl homology domain-containing protein [Pholiota conissans]
MLYFKAEADIRHVSGPLVSQEQASISLNPSSEPRSPKRPAICAFQPLPSITASPICTPTSSQSSRAQDDAYFSCSDSASSLPVLFPTSPPPTWIATPPTPPAKYIRRANTTSIRRYPPVSVSPSASFPASMHPHAVRSNEKATIRRSISVPALSFQYLEQSDAFSSFMGALFVQSPERLLTSDENPFDATFSIGDDTSGPVCTCLENLAGSYDKEESASPVSANEDDQLYEKDGTFTVEPSPAGSWSDHSIEDIRERERTKDALRKFHALKELLVTEAGYLIDLKALVTVYLRNLPTLAARPLTSSSTFGRASSSFTSGPWIHSYTQLQATALASSATLPDTAQSAASSASIKEPSKSNSRYLFSDSELESLTRNSEDILLLHEHFVRELAEVLKPLGLSMDMREDDLGHSRLGNLGAAIRTVSTKFATEASRFNAYQSFCAGHAEAMDILRKAYLQYPMEMEAFESRCMTMVSDTFKDGTASEPRHKSSHSAGGSPTGQTHLSVDDRKRAMSLTSLDGTVRSLRPRNSIIATKDSATLSIEAKREKSSPRIAFADYMIKPIQRICKYPLLLDQLLPSKALRTLSQNAPEMRSDVDVVVESAAQAMRHVASSVDEARHKQDVATQSAIIFSRICFTSSSGSNSPISQALTPDFLVSLGDCLLSGSLDVIHHSTYLPLGQNSSIKVKYLGAFLYSGGYLVLVKVSKGKKYEPRHWLSLAEFEVTDVNDDGAMLPCSFKVSSGDIYYELAAACQREKDAWLNAISEALKHSVSWINEPPPSYKFDVKGELLPESDDGVSDYPNGLTAIHSIPEDGNASEADNSEPFFSSLRGSNKSRRKRTGYETPPISRQDLPPPGPSRRSSSTSVKSIFSPMASDTETVVIRRSSQTARNQVDQELQDVISESCLTARSYAYSHEMELFQAPKTRSGSARSNSAIGMASMARLSKHESVRVPRRRTTDSLDGLVARGSSTLNTATVSKKNANKLTINALSSEEYSTSAQNQELAPSPSPPSSMSSPSRDRISSLRASEGSQPPSISSSSTPSTRENTPLTPRSFVRNVRGLFHFRPNSTNSPISVIVSHPSRSSIHPSETEHHVAPFHVIQRWTKDSLRRRPRSVHDDPINDESFFDDPEKRYSNIPSTRTPTPLST